MFKYVDFFITDGCVMAKIIELSSNFFVME